MSARGRGASLRRPHKIGAFIRGVALEDESRLQTTEINTGRSARTRARASLTLTPAARQRLAPLRGFTLHR